MRTSQISRISSLIALLISVSCSGEKKESQTEIETGKNRVKVETVSSEDVDRIGEFTASVEAVITNNITPQNPVRIVKLFAEVGDRVKAGQLLAQMDETSLTQAKIQLENQEQEFKRIDELYKIGGVSKSVWDAQKTQIEISRTSMKNLQDNIRLTSPIAGIVTARNYDNGDMYVGTNPVFTIAQIRPVKILVHVSEGYFTQVKKGNDTEIRLDVYGDEVFKGKVHLVYPTVDPATRTFPIEIRIPNADERVRPGMFARVTMNFGTRNHVVVPDLAIVKQTGTGDRYVYVYEANGTVSFRKVELGRRMGNRYEIISGVNDGDRVVIAGQSRLKDGMEVEIEK